jgi:RNA polymerase sigma factor (sigma-70 family)
MEISYHTVNLSLWPEDREQIEREVGRVEALVKNFPHPSYSVSIEKSLRKGGLGVSLGVRLSTRTLFATAWGGDIRSAIEIAADKVVRQAKRHLDVLREEERAGADTVRVPAETPAGPPFADFAAVRDLEDFRDRVADHAARLEKVLQRERRLHPKRAAAGWRISIPDIVEETLAYVFEHFREKPSHLTPDRWLVRRGLLALDEALARAGEEAGRQEEGGLPEIAESEDTRRIWADLQDLGIPEPRDLMDARPAAVEKASPEVLGDRLEAQRATAEALKALTESQRRVISLRHLEGYTVPEIAYVLNATEEQVGRWLAEAESSLRERLSRYR